MHNVSILVAAEPSSGSGQSGQNLGLRDQKLALVETKSYRVSYRGLKLFTILNIQVGGS